MKRKKNESEGRGTDAEVWADETPSGQQGEAAVLSGPEDRASSHMELFSGFEI